VCSETGDWRGAEALEVVASGSELLGLLPDGLIVRASWLTPGQRLTALLEARRLDAALEVCLVQKGRGGRQSAMTTPSAG
jgi:hypothetical protein